MRDENFCSYGTNASAQLFLLRTHTKEATMAGILMWLMGVPLVVIILLYLIF